MFRPILYTAVFLVIVHGLIHLIGFVAYWPLGIIDGLPYKTTLIGDRWAVGPLGMRLYSVLWLATAVGLIVSVIGLLTEQSWGHRAMWVAVILSIIITALDWRNAFRGTVISLIILFVLLVLFGLQLQSRPFLTYSQPTQLSSTLPARSTATWADEGTPWLVVEIDDGDYNVDVERYIRAEGPGAESHCPK